MIQIQSLLFNCILNRLSIHWHTRHLWYISYEILASLHLELTHCICCLIIIIILSHWHVYPFCHLQFNIHERWDYIFTNRHFWWIGFLHIVSWYPWKQILVLSLACLKLKWNFHSGYKLTSGISKGCWWTIHHVTSCSNSYYVMAFQGRGFMNLIHGGVNCKLTHYSQVCIWMLSGCCLVSSGL